MNPPFPSDLQKMSSDEDEVGGGVKARISDLEPKSLVKTERNAQYRRGRGTKELVRLKLQLEDPLWLLLRCDLETMSCEISQKHSQTALT